MANQEYVIRKVMSTDKSSDIEVHNLTYDSIELISMNDLLLAFNKKALSFAQDEKDHLREAVKWDLGLYTREQKQEMDARYMVIAPYLAGGVNDVKEYLKSYDVKLRPKSTPVLSSASFYRWVERYRRREVKMDLISLKTGPKGRRVDERLMVKLREFISNTDKLVESKSIRDKWQVFKDKLADENKFRTEKDQYPPITESTFRRVFNELHNPYPRDKQILGVSQADLKRDGVREGIIASRPLEYVELDWTPLDYVIVNFDNGEILRPVILFAIDKYSDNPLGFFKTFKNNPNAADWKQLLLHIMLPKTDIKTLYPKVQGEWTAYGKPENIIMDNAQVNDAEEISEVCGALGIGFIYNEKAGGHQKGTVENGLGQLNRIFHGIQGTTFSSLEERGQYDPSKHACVDINGLDHMLHVVFVDLMANKYNRGKGGFPEDIWREGLKNTHVHRTLPSRREYLELLFATETVYRTLTPKGIELKGEFFYSEEVNKLRLRLENEGRDRKVRVRHGSDVRVIYVLDESNEKYLEANLKQSSRLSRYGIDQRYPVHAEHLEYLCNKNNSAAYAFLNEQNNVGKALVALDEIRQDGKKEYSAINREKRRLEAAQTSMASAITGATDMVLLVPEDPNIILIEQSNETKAPSEDKDKEVRSSAANTIDEMREKTSMPSYVTFDADIEKLASQWGTGRMRKL